MKRPDLVLRNKLNNPMSNPETVEKMRQSLIGKKQSEETKLKRSRSLKMYFKSHPEAGVKLNKSSETYRSKIRGKGWRTARLKALERDNYKCQGCGEKDKRLVVHHLDFRGRNLDTQKEMNNELSNLVTWCDKCHNGFHRHKSKDYKERMKAAAP